MRGAFRPGAAPSVAGGYGGVAGRRLLVFLGLLALLVLGVVLGVGQGAVPIAPGEVVRALLGQSENPIITELRLPRVLAAVLVGAALGISGAVFQGLFRNPLADPYLMGAAAGAAFGVTLAVSAMGGLSGAFAQHAVFTHLPLSATLFGFLGALGAVALALLLSGGASRTGDLILAGVIVASVLVSLTSYLMLQDADRVRAVFAYTLGNLAFVGWSGVGSLALFLLFTFPLLLLLGRTLNALYLGEETARSLGLPLEKLKLLMIGAVTLLIAAAVAQAGIIGFVGLMAPHILRRLLGGDHHYLLPASALGGGGAALAGRPAGPHPGGPGGAAGGYPDHALGRAVLLVPAVAGEARGMRALRAERGAGPRRLETASLLADGVSFAYRNRMVLEGVRLELHPGEWLALLGPNGAGKSTLLRLMAGLVRPAVGEVRLGDERLERISSWRRGQQIAFLPQSGGYPEDLTVEEVVALGRTPHLGLLGRVGKADQEAVEWAMQETQVSAFRHRLLPTLSGGERQRVLLARALAARPQFLLLDEPTNHLDLHHQAEFLALLTGLRAQGLGILTVLHDPNLARLADRVAFLAEGRLLALGQPGEVLTEELLQGVYGRQVRVRQLEGQPVVLLGG